MAQDLTPQQIAAVMAARNARTQEEYNAILQAAGLTGAPLEYRESQTYSQDGVDHQIANPLTRQITQQINGSASNTWDPVTGKYTGLSSGMSEAMQTLMALTMLAGGAYGAYAAGGGAGAGAAGAAGAGAGAGGTGTAGGLVTLTPGEIAATNTAATAGLGGQVAGTMPSLGAYAGGAAGAAAGGAGSGSGISAGQAASAGTTGVNAMRQGEIAGYETNGSMPSSAAVDNGGGWLSALSKALGGNAGGLLGGLAGYLDSKDKQQKSDRAPWEPMQPYLLGLANDGSGIYNQLKQQPFSPAQQTAYGNVGGVLDVINQNAGGLLSGFQANASGANQFVRGQRRPLIGSSFNPTAQQWQPGLLAAFGTKG